MERQNTQRNVERLAKILFEILFLMKPKTFPKLKTSAFSASDVHDLAQEQQSAGGPGSAEAVGLPP